MKVILCCIARMEHDYIKEFVSWYKNLGVEKIVLYDNGFGDEPKYDSVLSDFINENYVEVIDYRDRTICQVSAYDDCYLRYGRTCDWMIFCDCDEFLKLKKHKKIDEYLSMDEFNEFDMICVNWNVYGDSEKIFKENNSVVKRFKIPSKTPSYFNNFTKTILRGRLNDIRFHDSHTPIFEDTGLRYCSENGTCENIKLPYVFNHKCEYACFNHYVTKSLEEFIEKVNRGYADQVHKKTMDELGRRLILDYFSINEITDEKLGYIKDKFGLSLTFDNPLGRKILENKEYDKKVKRQ